MRTDLCAAHHIRIAIHARGPTLAHILHGGDAVLPVASVLDVVAGALGHVGERVGDGFFGFLVDVVADGGPEDDDDVDEPEEEEEVEDELDVADEDGGEVGVRGEVGEEGGDAADGGSGGWGVVAGRAGKGIFGVGFGASAAEDEAVLAVALGIATAALVDPAGEGVGVVPARHLVSAGGGVLGEDVGEGWGLLGWRRAFRGRFAGGFAVGFEADHVAIGWLCPQFGRVLVICIFGRGRVFRARREVGVDVVAEVGERRCPHLRRWFDGLRLRKEVGLRRRFAERRRRRLSGRVKDGEGT